ncbi:MAG: type II secretion system protein [Patescibacteria group bacterium]|nr:type II secretion system protein [Patescibacteria group bacterium]
MNNKGFTIIETLVAVLILALALNSLFAVISTNIFSAKYAKNEITAMYLAQEAIDHIRNDRDTVASQGNDWSQFLFNYGYDISTSSTSLCFSGDGCYFDANNWDPYAIQACSGECPPFTFDSSVSQESYYTYNSFYDETFFARKIRMIPLNSDEIAVLVEVNWINGSRNKTYNLSTSLLKW